MIIFIPVGQILIVNQPHYFILIKLSFSHCRSLLGTFILSKAFGGLEQNLRWGRCATPGPQGPCIRSSIFISLYEVKSRVSPQEHFPTPELNSLALPLKLL